LSAQKYNNIFIFKLIVTLSEKYFHSIIDIIINFLIILTF